MKTQFASLRGDLLAPLRRIRRAWARIWAERDTDRRIRRLAESGTSLRLNMGCGDKAVPGWVNADLDGSAEFYVDATQVLPFASGSVALVYCEHLIAHLTKRQARHFLRECWRCLGVGGVIRISTPDLRAYAQAYLNDGPAMQRLAEREMAMFPTAERFGQRDLSPTDVFNRCVCYEGDRYYSYDGEELSRMLTEAGFAQVTRCPYGESTVAELCGMERHESGQYLPFMERFYLVVEARK